MRQLSFDDSIRSLIEANAPVAYGVSGGKDSSVMVLEGQKVLDTMGHTGPRILIHSDLGTIEWKESLIWCQKLAEHTGLELVVVKRKAGGMLERWEKRWADNVARYLALKCVTLITPWSTPMMRFCTSELKVDPICSRLRQMFPGQVIINARGIRKQESPNRAKSPVSKPENKLTTKSMGTSGYSWNPILDYTLDEVWEVHKDHDFPLHPAYTDYGSTRLSCSLCILASQHDHLASLSNPENHPAMLRIVDLELLSAFSFQAARWVTETALDILPFMTDIALDDAKNRRAKRQALEETIPKDLLFKKGWPERMPTPEEAVTLAGVRKEVGELMGFADMECVTPASVRERYADMLRTKQEKDKR